MVQHYNGGGGSKESYFEIHGMYKDEALAKTYGLASFYVNAPWEWAKYWVESKCRSGVCYPITLEYDWPTQR